MAPVLPRLYELVNLLSQWTPDAAGPGVAPQRRRGLPPDPGPDGVRPSDSAGMEGDVARVRGVCVICLRPLVEDPGPDLESLLSMGWRPVSDLVAFQGLTPGTQAY